MEQMLFQFRTIWFAPLNIQYFIGVDGISVAMILLTASVVLAGILVSIWMIWYPPSAIVVTAAAVIATVVYMGIGALGVLGPIDSSFLFTLVFAVIAANVCWLLTRRFARAA